MSRMALVWVLSACSLATGVPGCGSGLGDSPSVLVLPVRIGAFSMVPEDHTYNLRYACWFLSDDDIIKGLLTLNDSWQLGRSYQDLYDTAVSSGCGGDCLECAVAQIDFVYLIAR